MSVLNDDVQMEYNIIYSRSYVVIIKFKDIV